MPAMFPVCTVMTEVSFIVIESSGNYPILEVSPDRILVCSKNSFNCTHDRDTILHCSKATVHFEEICNTSTVFTIPYSVPTYVVLKLICQMAAMKVYQCILGMKTYESIIFLHCEHGTHIWGCLWSQLNDLYGHKSVKKPSKLHADTDFNRTALEFFTSANCSLLCELPLMKSMFEHTDECNVQGPYLHIGNIYEELIDWDECIKLMENLKQEYKEIINICHNLS